MNTSRISLWAITILGIFVAIGSYRFLFLGLELSFPDMLGHVNERQLAFVLHISAAPAALVTGAIQFFPKLRARQPGIHRWAGRIYGIAILIGGMSGLSIAVQSAGGLSAQLGFGLLSVAWIFVTARAIQLAMTRCIAAHRHWMIRSFALTFAGVTLRLYLPMFMAAGYGYTQASVYLAWLCWVPNLIFAEWLLSRSKRQRGTA